MARLRGTQTDIQDAGSGGDQTDPLQDTPPPDATAGAAKSDLGQSSQSPRERAPMAPTPPPIGAAPAGGNVQAAPQRPDVPTPQAGQASVQPPPQGVTPFQPLQGVNPAAAATPRLRGLYGGGTSGLTGGGLGVPFNAAAADPITSLIQQLLQSQQK